MLLALSLPTSLGVNASAAELIEPVRPFVEKVETSLDDLSKSRKQFLQSIANDVAKRIESEGKAELNFICTHNSRRSHLAQVWFQTAAVYYQVPQIVTYSGGTEATACNIRTVQALRRAGLSIVATSQQSNPIYLVQCAEDMAPMRAFSKVYHSEGNPQKGFIAMMCCSDADEACPVVLGSDARYPLHYEDPKVADNTDQETSRYDERSLEIAREMFFIVRQAAEQVKR
ncbi:protein-tyrosine-phosphatase [Roseiconus sp. JC912]|uniref:protein-tyrosine-phosphatase n=1 Tax=Roseiconus sp. JC912 TaxID=3396307 RepID=UPI003A4C7D5A